MTVADDSNEVEVRARTGGGKAQEIDRLIAPSVEALGFEIVRVQLSGGSGRRRLQIMVERPDGRISIEDCSEVSRMVSALLEVEDPIEGAYDLEVSSPGLDRPLTRLKDYVRFAGHEAKLELEVPREGRKRFRGKLLGLEGETVLLDDIEAKQRQAIPFREIAKAKLVLTDALLATAGNGRDAKE